MYTGISGNNPTLLFSLNCGRKYACRNERLASSNDTFFLKHSVKRFENECKKYSWLFQKAGLVSCPLVEPCFKKEGHKQRS